MDSHLSVTSLIESDVSPLQELFRSAGPFVRERGASDYWLYARLFRDTCIGVKDGGQMIGALIAFRDQSRDCREIYVQDLAVRPEWRCHGIGVALMRELIRRAAQWQIKRIWLTSERENEAAVRLWRRLGFVNHRADYLDNGLWVTRDLKGPGCDRVIFAYEPHDEGNSGGGSIVASPGARRL